LVSGGILEVSVGVHGKGDLKHDDGSLLLFSGSLGELHNLESGDLGVLMETKDLSSDKFRERDDVGDGGASSSKDNLLVLLLVRDEESVGSSQVLAESGVLRDSKLVLRNIFVVSFSRGCHNY